jgi:hypothetical protein
VTKRLKNAGNCSQQVNLSNAYVQKSSLMFPKEILRGELAENRRPLTKCYQHTPIAIIIYSPADTNTASSYDETVLVERCLGGVLSV